MDFNDFVTVNFAPGSDVGFVYVCFYVDGTNETPFYVGETQSIWGRANDYFWADFKATTDFRVGEAAKYLAAKGYQICIKYKASLELKAKSERLKEEKRICGDLRNEGHSLLNDCP